MAEDGGERSTGHKSMMSLLDEGEIDGHSAAGFPGVNLAIGEARLSKTRPEMASWHPRSRTGSPSPGVKGESEVGLPRPHSTGPPELRGKGHVGKACEDHACCQCVAGMSTGGFAGVWRVGRRGWRT